MQPGESLVEVAQNKRKAVIAMANSVSHKQSSAYNDAMVDNVYLNGAASLQSDAGKRTAFRR